MPQTSCSSVVPIEKGTGIDELGWILGIQSKEIDDIKDEVVKIPLCRS